ncbi:unnamed protein product, partial [Chrysoparadoxa australica]
LVLDRLPKEQSGRTPLLTPFGVHCLEKLGDVLLRNGKYEYGVLALERAIECYAEVHQGHNEYHKLIRKVTRITLEYGDMERALAYHVFMMRRAQKGGNVNEFVYLTKEVSHILLKEGWYGHAEQYLKVASKLVAGRPLSWAKIDQASQEGQDAAREGISTTGGAGLGLGLGAENFTLGGPTDWHTAGPKVTMTYQDAMLAGVPWVYLKSSPRHHAWGGHIPSGGGHLHASTSHGSNLAGLGKLLPWLSFFRHITVANSPKQSVTIIRAHTLFTLYMLQGGGTLLLACSLTCGSNTIGGTGVMETQQYELQTMLVEVLMKSLQYDKALRVLHQLLKRQVPNDQRPVVLMQAARCYLKVQNMAACEAALERIVLEADEVLDLTAQVDHDPERTPRVGRTRPRPATRETSGSGVVIPVTEEAVTTVRSVEFLALRARCRLAAKDPSTALHWANIALAVATSDGQKEKGMVAKLHYLKGRCYKLMVSPDLEEERPFGSWCDGTDNVEGGDGGLGQLASKCEAAFMEAHQLYLADNQFSIISLSVLMMMVPQAKCLTLLAEMHVSRIFPEVLSGSTEADLAAGGTGRQVLEAAAEKSSMSLELAGDIGAPLLLVSSLLNTAEVYWLQGRLLLAYQAWKEAHSTLCLTYLQRQDAATYMAEHQAAGHCRDGAAAKSGGSGQGFSPWRLGTPTAFDSQSGQSIPPPPGYEPQPNRVHQPALPTVPHPPSTLLRVHLLLSRTVRMAFALASPLPSMAVSTHALAIASSALPSSIHLLNGWILLDGQVQQAKPHRQTRHKRQHRRGHGTAPGISCAALRALSDSDTPGYSVSFAVEDE